MHEFATSYADQTSQGQVGYEVGKDSLGFALQGYATASLHNKFPEPGVNTSEVFGVVACGVCEDTVCTNRKDDVKNRFNLPDNTALYAFEDGVRAALGEGTKLKEAV